MKMKLKSICLATIAILLLASCEYDNYDMPNAILSGRVVYEGSPVGVRATATRLELWQDGYANRTKIDVNIAHDGTYSAALFNGRYKIVRVAGAPWEAQPSDTIVVDVKGNTTQDVEVSPFSAISNENIHKESGNTVQVQFTVKNVVQGSKLEEVKLFFSKNMILDNNLNDGTESLDISTIESSHETTATVNIPVALVSENYIFTRLGVRSDKSNEFYYTQVQKLQLK